MFLHWWDWVRNAHMASFSLPTGYLGVLSDLKNSTDSILFRFFLINMSFCRVVFYLHCVKICESIWFEMSTHGGRKCRVSFCLKKPKQPDLIKSKKPVNSDLALFVSINHNNNTWYDDELYYDWLYTYISSSCESLKCPASKLSSHWSADENDFVFELVKISWQVKVIWLKN